MKFLIAMTSTVLLAATAAPAVAQSGGGAPQTVVSYADLNLSSSAGRTELQQRLSHAVDMVCPTSSQRMGLDQRAAYDSCRKQAWASIRPQLAHPQFAEVQVRTHG
jgi:UrcA family protein